MASHGFLTVWDAKEGEELEVLITLEKAGTYSPHIVAAHWPESGAIAFLMEGTPLNAEDLGGAGEGTRGSATLILKSEFHRRLLSTRFQDVKLDAGEHRVVIKCTEKGRFGFDYLWFRLHGR